MIESTAGDPEMAKFVFKSPPVGDADYSLMIEFEEQLRPLIADIVHSAVIAGWSQEDVLLALVELSWNMYEERRKGS